MLTARGIKALRTVSTHTHGAHHDGFEGKKPSEKVPCLSWKICHMIRFIGAFWESDHVET